jgi:hypothetical protein
MGSMEVIPWYYYYFFGALEPVSHLMHDTSLRNPGRVTPIADNNWIQLINVDPRSSRRLLMYLHTERLCQRPLTPQSGTYDRRTRRNDEG